MSKYHDILGVTADTSEADVKKAYRKLASANHPDKGGDEEKFKEVKEAYERVTSPEKFREEFGGGRPQGNTPWGNINININDIDDLAAHFRFHQSHQRQQQSVRLQFELTLESTMHDQKREIHVPEYNIPPMEITIPAGIRHGETVQYGNIPQDQGSTVTRVLMVQFVIRPHTEFHISGPHLVKEMTVDAFDAMVGTTLTVKTIDDATLAIKLPAGSENGTKLKIGGKGLKYKDNPTFRGDMYVVINISMPVLNKEEKDIITKLRDKRQK